MDKSEWKRLIIEYITKYRWAAMVILTGLVLLTIPDQTSNSVIPIQEEPVQEMSLQQELEELLAKLDGAGKVKVLLTPAIGSETYYQTDTAERNSLDSVDRQADTVLIEGNDRGESGLIRRIDPPVYRGAIILCQGAGKPQVKLAVVDAVSTATGLTSDKISVWKMK